VKKSLHDFGVDFDVFTHENTLHESGAVEHAIDRLKKLGHIFEADGATWLRTTEFGDDKDRVIIKKDGEAAYMSGDLAYYLDKRERGFERNIILLSPGMYVAPRFRKLQEAIIAEAVRAHVVINAVDPRGAYVRNDPDDPSTWTDTWGIAEATR